MITKHSILAGLCICGLLLLQAGDGYSQASYSGSYPIGGTFVPVPATPGPAPAPGVYPRGAVPHQPPPPGDTVVGTMGTETGGMITPGTTGTLPPGTMPTAPPPPPGANPSYSAAPPGTGIPSLYPSAGATGDIVWDSAERRYGTRPVPGSSTTPYGLAGRTVPLPGAGATGPAAAAGREGGAPAAPSSAPFGGPPAAPAPAPAVPGGTTGTR